MCSNFVSYALLLCCSVASLSTHVIVKREPPPSSGPSQSSSGEFGEGHFGSGSFGSGDSDNDSFGGFDASISSSSDSFDTPSGAGSLDISSLSGSFGSEGFDHGDEFRQGSFLPINNDISSSTNHGAPVTLPSTGYQPSRPSTPQPSHNHGARSQSHRLAPRPPTQPGALQPSHNHGAPSQPQRLSSRPPTQPSHNHGAPSQPQRPSPRPPTLNGAPSRPSHSHGAPSRPSQSPGAPSRPSTHHGIRPRLSQNDETSTSSYEAPPASAGSGDYIGNGGSHTNGDSSWHSIQSRFHGSSSGRIDEGFSAPLHS